MNQSPTAPNSQRHADARVSVVRRRDSAIYTAFGLYVAAVVIVMASVRGFAFIDAGKAFATVVPAFALLALIAFQASSCPRCSALAFCLVFAGVVLSALIALLLAGAASAAV